jgi:hypothetical protein
MPIPVSLMMFIPVSLKVFIPGISKDSFLRGSGGALRSSRAGFGKLMLNLHPLIGHELRQYRRLARTLAERQGCEVCKVSLDLAPAVEHLQRQKAPGVSWELMITPLIAEKWILVGYAENKRLPF